MQVIDWLRESFNHWLRHLAGILFTNLLIFLVRLVPVVHGPLLLFLKPGLFFCIFGFYLFKVWIDFHRVLFPLFHYRLVFLMFSMLIIIYLREILPHIEYALIVLLELVLIVATVVFEWFELQLIQFALTVEHPHQCVLAFLVLLLGHCLFVLCIFLLQLL